MGTTVVQSGFLSWFSQWGQVVYFFVQMAFWVVIAVAAMIVALQYSRLVDFKTGRAAAKKDVAASKAGDSVEVDAE